MSPNDPSQPLQNLLTTRELAGHFHCSERHIWIMRKRGLPHIRVGSLIRYDLDQVRRWLEAEDSARCAPNDERARQLADIAATGDADNAECAAADLARERPPAAL